MVSRAHKELLELTALPDSRANVVHKVNKDPRVDVDHVVVQDNVAQLGRKVVLVKREIRVKKVHLVLQAKLANMAPLVLLDSQDQKDLKVYLEKMAFLDILDNGVNPGLKGKLAILAPLV